MKITEQDIKDGLVASHETVDGKRVWTRFDTPGDAIASGGKVLRQEGLPMIDWRQSEINKPKPPRRTGKANGHHSVLRGLLVRVRSLDSGKALDGMYSWLDRAGNRLSSSKFRIVIPEDRVVVFRDFILPKKDWAVVWYKREEA